jgi:DNA-binding transcriptional ArsR family regulator
MLELRLDGTDLGRTRFVTSPLAETVYSLVAWKHPAYYPEHAGWLAQLRERIRPDDAEVLAALIPPHRWLPDFLTPPPDDPHPTIEAQLAALRGTPKETLVGDIAAAFGDGPVPWLYRDLADDPRRVLDRIVAALGSYWCTCLAPWWPRMERLLHADVLHRMRIIATGGVQAVFPTLSPECAWADGTLTLAKPIPPHRIQVGGRGLKLMPTLFLTSAGTMIDPARTPLVCYPAHARGALSARAVPAAPEILVDILGRTRARLLALLAVPATTTQVAELFQVTPGAVSRHLSALHRASLLDRVRDGRRVWYVQSPLGRALHDQSSAH